MNTVGRKVAIGAVWMVGLRLLERAIGFISTLVLARLLLPSDFGLVAIAMSIYAFVEVAGNFGFDLALLREKDPSREAYDSAWTLYVIYGVFAFVLLLLLAWPATQFHGDGRLLYVMIALGFLALIQGFDNIGIVQFRKEFRFGAEFRLMLYRKLVSFVVTVGFAFVFRNYWALIGGMVAHRVSGTVLSYAMHPFRPRFDLTHARALFGFSKWLVMARLMECLKNRGPDVIIGRSLGLAAVGMHRLSIELATLATSELILPILRAVFPGYAAVAHDRKALATSFLRVQGSIVLVTLPVGLCFVLLPDLVVRALLGANWIEATPLLMIFGISGCLSMFQLTSLAIFEVLGLPQRSMWLRTTENLILIPAVAAAIWMNAGLVGAAWCWVAVQALLIPLSAWMIHGLLPLTVVDRLAVLWRPILGALAMALVIHTIRRWLPFAETSVEAFGQLFFLAGLAVFSFVVVVFAAWWVARRPFGPESSLVEWILNRATSTVVPNQ